MYISQQHTAIPQSYVILKNCSTAIVYLSVVNCLSKFDYNCPLFLTMLFITIHLSNSLNQHESKIYQYLLYLSGITIIIDMLWLILFYHQQKQEGFPILEVILSVLIWLLKKKSFHLHINAISQNEFFLQQQQLLYIIYMFSKFFKQQNDFEKSLSNSSILNDAPSLNIVDLKQLMQGFPQKQNQSIQQVKTPQPIRKTFQKFFLSLPDKLSFRVKLKIQATCHVLLDDFMHGISFSEYLLEWDGFKIKEKNNERERFIQMYYELLQRFANALPLLKMAKSQKNYTLQTFYEEQSDYYKAINLLNLIFTYTSFIKEQLFKQGEEIIGEIVLLMWNDVIAIYLFIEKIIIQFVQEYQSLLSQTFFQVLELVPDFVKLTPKIQQFYHLNDYFKDEKQFLEPNWKWIDNKQLEELDNFKQKLIIQSARGRIQKKSCKTSFSTQLFSPQHQNSCSFFNTTFGYVKRLSTVDDPFEINNEEAQKKFKNLIK